MTTAIVPKIATTEMQVIKTWEDITSFENRVVAYETDSRPIKDRDIGYELIPGSPIRFGYINGRAHPYSYIDPKTCEPRSETGYSMARLIKKVREACTCALINPCLGNTTMRLATGDEIRKIEEAIKGGQATFEYMSDKEIDTLLKQHLGLWDRIKEILITISQ